LCCTAVTEEDILELGEGERMTSCEELLSGRSAAVAKVRDTV
jgi:hypothetical protein